MNVTRYASKRCLSPLRCCNQNIIISDDISRCVSPIRYLGSRPILDSEINKTFGIETKSKRIEVMHYINKFLSDFFYIKH